MKRLRVFVSAVLAVAVTLSVIPVNAAVPEGTTAKKNVSPSPSCANDRGWQGFKNGF